MKLLQIQKCSTFGALFVWSDFLICRIGSIPLWSKMVSLNYDPGVNAEQLDLFENKLGAKVLLEHGFGHFGSADGVFEVPLVRDELLAMVKQRD